jgi:hypothetical protein
MVSVLQRVSLIWILPIPGSNPYLEKRHCHSMTNWLQLRRNVVAYYDFYKNLLPSTVGKRNFKIRLNTMAEGEAIATVSDEALALLGIENAHRLWDDVWTRSARKVRVIWRDKPYPDEWISTVCPRYTRTSKADPTLDNQTEDKRWTQAGICGFNALRKAIIADRQAYPGFKVRWLCQAHKAMKGLVDPDVDGDNEDKIVDADDDLFDSVAPSQTHLTAAKQVHGTAEYSSSDDESDDDDD